MVTLWGVSDDELTGILRGLAARNTDRLAQLPIHTEPTYPSKEEGPAARDRVRFTFSGSEEFLGLLRRAQEVTRHTYPAGDLDLIFQEALELLLDRRDPGRRLRAKDAALKQGPARGRPAPVWAFFSRRVPQGVRDEVWRRDAGQCVSIGAAGQRCPERGGLEFDHIVPHALGGASNNPKNIRLLCRNHNQAAARAAFGFEKCRPKPSLRRGF